MLYYHKLMLQKTKQINLAPLYKDPVFRQMMLYFIRLVLHGLGNIIYAYYDSQNSKTRKNRRLALKTSIGKTIDDKPKWAGPLEDCETHLNDREIQFYDLSSRPAESVLRNLEKPAQDSMLDFFREEVRFIDWERFDDILETIILLREKRNFLEHYKEQKHHKKQKRNLPTDDALLWTLGRFLLPRFSGLLEGQLSRKKWQAQWPSPVMAKLARAKIAAGREARKQTRKTYAAQTRTRASIKDKHRRQKLHNDNEQFRLQYLELFPKAYQRTQAYRLWNLRDHYYALGKHTFKRLCADLGDKAVFSDIEIFYKLHIDIGLIFALEIGTLQEEWEAGWDTFPDKFRKLCEARDKYQTHETAYERFAVIRNHIAHGRLVLQEEGAETVFTAFFTILDCESTKARTNEIYDALKRLFRKRQRLSVWVQEGEDAHMIRKMDEKHWSADRRATLEAIRNKGKRWENYITDYNPALRKQVAKWVNALRKAYQQVYEK